MPESKKYYVAYSYNTEHGKNGVGTEVVAYSKPIETEADVSKLAADLKGILNHKNVTAGPGNVPFVFSFVAVLSWQELKA